MTDRHVSLNCVCAWALWVVAVAVAVADLLVVRDDIGYFGIIAAAGAATLHTVGAVRNHVADRERNAFQIGRDSTSVRAMR